MSGCRRLLWVRDVRELGCGGEKAEEKLAVVKDACNPGTQEAAARTQASGVCATQRHH